jgi:hypothetical protein
LRDAYVKYRDKNHPALIVEIVQYVGDPAVSDALLMDSDGAYLVTRAGRARVNIGDFVVTTASGQCYPTTAEYIAAKFELV